MKKSKFAAKNKHSKVADYIDLHIHSNYSDGQHPVDEIMETCSKVGMKAMAFTDHDTLDGYFAGQEIKEDYPIELIPGIELSSFIDGSEIHILGYLFDPNNLTLNQTLSDLQEKRQVRVQNIVNKLNKNGVEISLSRVLEKSKGTSIGRPHIAQVLLEEEYVSNFQQAFDKYLSTELIEEFETEKLKPVEAIELISQAGGVPVLAHPYKTRRDDLIEMMVDAGLKGIETYCNNVGKSASETYNSLAKKYELICCGGADFHNNLKDKRYGLGSVKVPYSCLSELKNWVDDSLKNVA